MNNHTFLFEIGTEELPHKKNKYLYKNFILYIKNEFIKNLILFNKIKFLITPCRLSILINGLSYKQSNFNIKNKGPYINKKNNKFNFNSKISKKWAKKIGINIKESSKIFNNYGKWFFYQSFFQGKNISKLLYNIIKKSIENMIFLKIMRWNINNKIKFIRPVRTITIMLDDIVIYGKILGIYSNRIIYGHKIIGSKIIFIKHAEQYKNILFYKGYVIVNFNQRKKFILKEIKNIAKNLKYKIYINKTVIEEITFLVEWPVILISKFKKKFLSIPYEILIFIIKSYNKYISIHSFNGYLLNFFIFVANIVSNYNIKIILDIAKLINSKLSDVNFFLKIDNKKKLKDRLKDLSSILLQNKLGTLKEKSYRIKKISSWIATKIGANIKQSERAGLLSKCDLATKMVFEFNDMQGIIGMHYAKNNHEQEIICIALKEQYYPRFSKDKIPNNLVSCAVSIADKIDNIIGCFAINEIPNGNKDPFYIRRSVLGILRIIIEKNLNININSLAHKSAYFYKKKIFNSKKIVLDVINFIILRLIIFYTQKGYQKKIIKSLIKSKKYIKDFNIRLKIINKLYNLRKFKCLIKINKRICNILSKYLNYANIYINKALFIDPNEINLLYDLLYLIKKIKFMINKRHYYNSIIEMIKIRKSINIFFNNVIVISINHNLCFNRINLLYNIYNIMLEIYDFSQIY
ncbi:MAG: glycine--tRNA ligase subunit beta [Candidatus Makana argininalis]